MRSLARIVLLVFVLSILLTFMGVMVHALPTPGSVNESAIDNDAQTGMKGIAGALLRYLQVFGSIAAVLIIAVYGVQWFLASPQEKAALKEKAWSYVIGAVLVFGGATIISWVAATFSGAFKSP